MLRPYTEASLESHCMDDGFGNVLDRNFLVFPDREDERVNLVVFV